MTNITVFEKVASGQYTAEQGAKLMLDSDKAERDARKPAWMPMYAWALTTLVVCLILSIFGIRRDA
ncbi:MAG TPA: hypothetical protein VIM14_00855 [Polyangia bacterium]